MSPRERLRTMASFQPVGRTLPDGASQCCCRGSALGTVLRLARLVAVGLGAEQTALNTRGAAVGSGCLDP